MPAINRQVLLKSRPNGIPQADNFEIIATPAPVPGDRQFLVRNEFLSVEPAMRGWVSAVANYSTPVGIGEVMRSFSAGTVIASRHPGFAEGDRVMGMLGWQELALSDGSNITRKVVERDLPLSLSLGVLGLNGITAYFGLLDLGLPRPGDTGRGLDRGRRRRLRGRADCQADGLPRHRHHRGAGEDEALY